MPAIQLAKLRQSSAQLAELFDQPEAFVRKLHSILSEYANRAHRAGQTGEPAPLLDSYNVPKPVLRQVLTDVKPMAENFPKEALILCDALWGEIYYEHRFLAASILGLVTPDPPEPVLDHVIRWSEQITDVQLMQVLFDKGLERIRVEKPELLTLQIDRWLGDPNDAVKKLGLQALMPLIRTTNYENLPIFFRYITPLIRELPSSLRVDLRDVVKELAIRSPTETAYFLRQMIGLGSHINASWLARQNLRYFPPGVQDSLRELLRTPVA